MKFLLGLLILIFLTGCVFFPWFPFGMTQQNGKHSLDELREKYGKYKGWICIYPAPSATGNKCVAQAMSCQWAFKHCERMRILADYRIRIMTFYVPRPELDFDEWTKCWKEAQDFALEGYR